LLAMPWPIMPMPIMPIVFIRAPRDRVSVWNIPGVNPVADAADDGASAGGRCSRMKRGLCDQQAVKGFGVKGLLDAD
jgi:hypothetical protein